MTDIQTEIRPPLAWVILNRPERRNAVTAQMWAALPGIAAQLAADPAIRVALVRGAGHEAFSAGADIVEMTQNAAHPERMRAMQQAVLEGQLAWARLANYDLTVIPLFLLMGAFATQGGLSRSLFTAASALIGHLRGGRASRR